MSALPPRIVVVGSSNTDLVVKAPTIPAPGETVLGGTFLTTAGGKGANQAVAAARLGAEVTLVARIGDDAFGRGALEDLGAAGVQTDCITVDPTAPSGVALIVVDDQAENAIAVAPGANSRLDESDIDRARERIRAAQVLLLQLEIPAATVHYAATLATDAGVTVILNPAPAPAGSVIERSLRAVSVLTPNTVEAAALTGIDVTDEDAARAAAVALRARGVSAVVITLGADGALWLGPDGEGRVPGTPVAAVDTTAAGDAFNGALAFAVARGDPLDRAVHLATLAGALAATRLGARPSLPTLAAIESLGASDTSFMPRG